jgi:alpha-ribazole phosphatase
MSITTIDLMRHGEPVGGRKYRGQTDDPLSEKGWQQMWATVGAHRPWTHIVSSPLSRCHAFATELAGKHALPLNVDPRFMEVKFGEWEGQTQEQLKARDPDIIARFRRDPIGQRPVGAEPLGDFHKRVAAAWQDVLERHRGKHVLVVCHAGVIRMVFSHVLGVPLERTYFIDVPSAGLTRITVEGTDGIAQLRFHHGRL